MKVKKFSKRAFAVLLTVLLVLSAVPLCAGAVEDTSDFKYELHDDGTATITRYRGSASSLVIPSEIDGYKVTGIDFQAFADCKSLTSVTIPDSVTSIGDFTFLGCTSLESINVGSNNANYSSEDGVFFNKDKTELFQYPAGKTLTEYSISDSVASINWYAFSDCTSLVNITIPDSVTGLGGMTFKDCISLTSVTIPDSVTSIGDGTFWGCMSLTSVTIPDSITSIGGSAFEDCTSLTSVTIPDSVTSIGDDTFWGCTSLENINVGSNNANYSSEDGVLFNKDKTELIQYPIGKTLTEYSLPDSVTSIGILAFMGCTSLTSVTLPESLTSIGNSAFWDCTSLTSVIIPDGVTLIAPEAFRNCTSLTTVTIPDSVTWIGKYAFFGCTSLASVTIPKSVTTISMGAFHDCTSLTSVTIPESVTIISMGAFWNCASLTSITIPNSVITIDRPGFSDTVIDGNYSKIENFTICGYTGTEAENYATENGFTFIALDNENYIHNDSNSGISVIAKADADLAVSEITDEQGISNANTLLGGAETVKNLYDISLTKDGEKVQHEGMAEVKIPCDNENAKVYRVENDNTLTDMNAVYTDGNLVFHTEHFSLYIVAEEKKETETVGDMNRDGKLDVTDVTAIQIELANTGTDYYDTVADTDKDGKVDVADVTYLQQFIADTIIKF